MSAGPAELLRELKALSSIEPTRPGAEDVAAMDARQRRIEILYELSRRTNGLYTGLNEQPPF